VDGNAILIIEDNPLNMKLFRVLLRSRHYKVIEAEDAETGLALLRSTLPRLILMDVALPGMDGLNATRIIKADPALKDIPVIVLTSHAMTGDEGRALEAGCDAYMSKPIDTRLFLETVSQFLDRQDGKTARLLSGRGGEKGSNEGENHESEQNHSDC
jgi:CheY-like chemotaxis protein